MGTEEGDFVVDPFMGTGTTSVVCAKLKRVFMGFDISQEYVDFATARTLEYLEEDEDGRRTNPQMAGRPDGRMA